MLHIGIGSANIVNQRPNEGNPLPLSHSFIRQLPLALLFASSTPYTRERERTRLENWRSCRLWNRHGSGAILQPVERRRLLCRPLALGNPRLHDDATPSLHADSPTEPCQKWCSLYGCVDFEPHNKRNVISVRKQKKNPTAKLGEAAGTNRQRVLLLLLGGCNSLTIRWENQSTGSAFQCHQRSTLHSVVSEFSNHSNLRPSTTAGS